MTKEYNREEADTYISQEWNGLGASDKAPLIKPVLIGLTGMPNKVAQTGKSTISKYLVDKYGFQERGYADRLRQLAFETNPAIVVVVVEHIIRLGGSGGEHFIMANLQEILDSIGYEEAKKNPDFRRFYQNLGLGVRNVLGQDIWVESCFLTPLSGKDVVFDVRFNNEAVAIKERGGIIWAVDNPCVPELQGNHASEQGIDMSLVDGIIHNHGTYEELFAGIDYALKFNNLI